MISSLSSYNSEIVNLAVSGNLVFTEQIDHVVMGGSETGVRLMQISETTGDKICARRNYFNAAGSTGPSRSETSTASADRSRRVT